MCTPLMHVNFQINKHTFPGKQQSIEIIKKISEWFNTTQLGIWFNKSNVDSSLEDSTLPLNDVTWVSDNTLPHVVSYTSLSPVRNDEDRIPSFRRTYFSIYFGDCFRFT